MNRVSTYFLKITVLFMAMPAIAVCVFGVIGLIRNNPNQFPGRMHPSDIGFFAAVIPYFIALYTVMKLLGYIDNNTAFSELSVRALKKIKYCGVSIGIIFVAMMPFVFIMARQEDAPGIIVIGLAVAFASFVVAVFGALLERLLQNAIKLKSDNELTV
ncbi:hypothetical protein PghCCS26_19720 [Paenibacillus glycanilyticus]|uniref:DUF2975 domain-containing protein n=1 Tax=Paenibacillus glycanilyticus TaxID=126569 RepID=A0ABQ6NJA8_9BACL|nr:DUF2975 domain-containing protein [Paenibacillus glycanilyticus]GMK44844.1 hypothetical protein PghCCS26_19720 [Paenibacillus glycanilyticus]